MASALHYLLYVSENACFESRPVSSGLQLHSIRRPENTVDWKHVLSSDGVWVVNLTMKRKPYASGR